MVDVVLKEYAQLLSPCEHKGKLDLKEKEESRVILSLKLKKLAEFIRQSKYTVVHTGAGISTKAGIADFRGPQGLWTLEKKNQLKTFNQSSNSFHTALPTVAHYGIAQLCKEKLVQFVVTQNVDGLHRKSGVPEELLAEIHGCLFVGYCSNCNAKEVLETPTNSVGFRNINRLCSRCHNSLSDFVLDWYDELPKAELEKAIFHSKKAKLHIVIGSSLQMLPSRNFCLMSSKGGANLVIINLSETSQDSKATMTIRGDAERCMAALLFLLQLEVVVQVPKQLVHFNTTQNAFHRDTIDETNKWQLEVDCGSLPNSPCHILPVKVYSVFGSVDWNWNEKNDYLTVWVSSTATPTVSITFDVSFPKFPCCCRFSVQHSFSEDVLVNRGFSESFSLTSISSLKDIIQGFHLAYECSDTKTIPLLYTNLEDCFYKSGVQKRYYVCLLCGSNVYCTSRKRHVMRKHNAKKYQK